MLLGFPRNRAGDLPSAKACRSIRTSWNSVGAHPQHQSGAYPLERPDGRKEIPGIEEIASDNTGSAMITNKITSKVQATIPQAVRVTVKPHGNLQVLAQSGSTRRKATFSQKRLSREFSATGARLRAARTGHNDSGLAENSHSHSRSTVRKPIRHSIAARLSGIIDSWRNSPSQGHKNAADDQCDAQHVLGAHRPPEDQRRQHKTADRGQRQYLSRRRRRHH
jgi:hypothetical protein